MPKIVRDAADEAVWREGRREGMRRAMEIAEHLSMSRTLASSQDVYDAVEKELAGHEAGEFNS